MVSIDEAPGVLRFDVRVAPRASRDAILGVQLAPGGQGALKVALTAPPVDGQANAALIALLARALGVARRDVVIVHGETSRAKRVEVRGASAASVRALVR